MPLYALPTLSILRVLLVFIIRFALLLAVNFNNPLTVMVVVGAIETSVLASRSRLPKEMVAPLEFVTVAPESTTLLVLLLMFTVNVPVENAVPPIDTMDGAEV